MFHFTLSFSYFDFPSSPLPLEETSLKKKRDTQYNVYTDEDRRRYFHFLAEKLMKPKEAVKTANVNHTIRYKNRNKSKTQYEFWAQSSNFASAKSIEWHIKDSMKSVCNSCLFHDIKIIEFKIDNL
ncbi:hypothetical protein BCV71DRAFT_270307 [Rhizopus microsporus]|uniref:Uncharacterized protein n=1 Tax=Rhizopus microsporus TaxID=58291 RepID=A0A1X0RYH1_RHIZD|nr:hypothetical protein BCV71DRAFT_270307 [Rhizopus microsporus]